MQPRGSVIPRACRHCRVRKIRCDRETPCSNCKTARIQCNSSRVAHSLASAQCAYDDHASEPLESSRPSYEIPNDTRQEVDVIGKLNLIIRQLGALNQRLGYHSDELRVAGTGDQPTSSPARTPGADLSVPLVEGDISFRKQTILAAEAASFRLSASPSDGGLSTTLACLQSVVQSQTMPAFPASSTLPKNNRHGHILPVEVASILCQHANTHPPKAFLNYALRSSSIFMRSCSNLYFGPCKATTGQVASLHGLAYLCLIELNDHDDNLFDHESYVLHLKTCETIFDECLESRSVLMQPSPDNILALVLGILKAYATSQEALCEMLVGVAARHCLALGYNRATVRDGCEGRTKDVLHDQVKLFWMIYTFDKNMSLKSGRPPHIPDNDVDTKLPTITADPELRAWDEASLAYIRLAQIQGQIYNDLYCVSALGRPETDRQASIDELTSRLTRWKIDFSAIDTAGACHRDHFEFAHGSSDTIVESLRTIVHRASSLGPRRFIVSTDCLRAATDCLDAHVRYIARFSGHKAGILDGYVNGVLSWASLTPFAVVFMHAIVNRSPDDVACLQRATAAIGSISSLSTTCSRLHKLCCAFANCAAAVIPTDSGLNGHQTAQRAEGLPVPAPGFYPNTSASYYYQSVGSMPDIFMHWVDSNQPVFNFDFTTAGVGELNYENERLILSSGGADGAQWSI